MIIVALSGVVGRFIYRRVNDGLDGQRADLRELQVRAGFDQSEAVSKLQFAPDVEERLQAFEQHELRAAPTWLTHLRQIVCHRAARSRPEAGRRRSRSHQDRGADQRHGDFADHRVGQTVAASLQAPELFKLAQDLRRIRLEAQVNEADVGGPEGNTVTFTVDAYPERTFEGKVTQVRLAATELQSVVTYTVIIEASNDDRRLFPGMTANVQIEASKKDGVIRIPNDALRFKPRATQCAASRAAPTVIGVRDRVVARLKTDLELTPGAGTGRPRRSRQNRRRTCRGARRRPGRQRRSRGPAPEAAGGDRADGAADADARASGRCSKNGRRAGRTRGRATSTFSTPPATPDRRFVRLGISDEQFTEVVGGQLSEGERVVLRTRDVKK